MPPLCKNAFFSAAALLVALVAIAPAASAADLIEVYLDQAKIMQLPEKTASIIIGNPQVVDVAMLKGNRKVVLTGKGFGETNLIAIDKNGEALVEAVVKVAAAEKNLIVQRGLDRESYHCNPRCQPTVALGDATRFMGEASAQVSGRTIAATGAAR